MNSSSLRTTIKEYRWVIVASLLFVIWKFFLIGIMWEGRSIPPEPDDSYEYVAQIASVSECHTGISCPYPGVSITDHSGFTYLSYRVFLGSIGRFFSLSPETTFHAGFYIGTILLLFILPPFLRSFTSNKNLIAWSILFLTFFHGTGESHGFFWVVPSFLSSVLFFVLFTFIAREKAIPHWLAGIIAIIYTFSHPMSVYLVFIFPLYLVGLYIISETFEVSRLMRTSFIVFVVILSSFSQAQYLKHISQLNYYGIEQSLSQARVALSDMATGSNNGERVLGYSITKTVDPDLFKQRIATLDIAYFRYVIPHWIAIIPFMAVITLLFIKKNANLLSLYLSALIFFIIATFFNEFGFRSAIILWPLTFVAYAFAAWHLLGYAKQILKPTQRKICMGAILAGVLCFFIMNASLAITFNSNLNIHHKHTIDASFVGYLLKNMRPEDKVDLSGILVRTSGGDKLYLGNRLAPRSAHPKYIAIIDESGLPVEQKGSTITRNFATTIANRILGVPMASTIPNPNAPIIPSEYNLEKEFGVVKIYRSND